jgi:hypothetical protein
VAPQSSEKDQFYLKLMELGTHLFNLSNGWVAIDAYDSRLAKALVHCIGC